MKRYAAYLAAVLIGGYMIYKNSAPLGVRNNNPLNIRYTGAGWVGEVGENAGFSVFDSAENGIRAAAKLMRNYRAMYGINTISGLIARWAPAIENDTESYINSVSEKTRISSDAVLSDDDYRAVLTAMIYHENGVQPYDETIINNGFMRGFYG